MKQFPVRPVLAGVLIAAAIFIAPFFLLKAALFIALIAGAAKLLGYGGRWRNRFHRAGLNHPFADAGLPFRKPQAREVAID